VLGFLAVLIVASLALIPLVGSAGGPPPAEPQEDAAEVVPDTDADAVDPDADAVDPDADAVDPDADAVDPDADAVDPDADAVDPDADAVDPGADAVDPDTDAVDPDADADVDADGSGGDPDVIPDQPVDSLTVEGTGGTAAGLVDPAPDDGDIANGGETDGDAAGTDGDTAGIGGTAGAATDDVDPEVSGDAGAPTASETQEPGIAGTPPPPAPTPDQDATPPADAATPLADDEVIIPPEPDDDRYEPDDPDRIPAVTMAAAPRDRLAPRVDLDGDGIPERIWAAIVADVVHIRVDELVGGRWRNGPVRRGPVADRLVDLRIADLTGDGRPEIWTWQWVATEGQTITLWSYAGDELRRMEASGGCWSGSNTFGLVGALVQRATPGRPIQIAAICEDSTLPWWQWPSALYRWEDGRWTAHRLVGKYR
jgi:hypothetical protein